MTASKRRKRSQSVKTVRVELTADDLATLRTIADYYQKSMGPMRFVVRFTTAPDMRRRLDFLTEESRVLRLFIEDGQEKFFRQGELNSYLDFTPTALIAFWGRLLASLNSRRSRRKMSAAEAEHRETLAKTLGAAAGRLKDDDAGELENALVTRRPVEQGWMRASLAGDAET